MILVNNGFLAKKEFENKHSIHQSVKQYSDIIQVSFGNIKIALSFTIT